MIDIEKEIVKRIGIRITEDDVDGFIDNLDYLFKDMMPNLSTQCEKHKVVTLEVDRVFSTLYKIWLDVKQDE